MRQTSDGGNAQKEWIWPLGRQVAFLGEKRDSAPIMQLPGRGGKADATDLKSVGDKSPCGFDSRRPEYRRSTLPWEDHVAEQKPAKQIDPGVRIGHVHLKVADL